MVSLRKRERVKLERRTLFMLSGVPRQGTCLHCQEYWFSTRKTPFIERYFLYFK